MAAILFIFSIQWHVSISGGETRERTKIMFRRIALILSVFSIIGGSLYLSTANANAAPPTQLANNADSAHMICENRFQGGTSQGTGVIAWNCGDSNNYFNWNQYDTACGNGVVTYDSNTGTGCPFSSGALDLITQGDPIAMDFSVDTGLCVGNPNSNGGGTVLTGCGDNAGNGRGWGTMYVLILTTGLFGYDGHPIQALNTRWSNFYNKGRYICFNGYDNRLTLSCDGSDSTNAFIKRI